MALGRCEFVDSRLRRSPPDRAGAVSYGQAGENALRFPHLAHRSAAVHKPHSTAATSRIDFDSGKGETFNRLQLLAYSSRNLSKRLEPSQWFEWTCQASARHKKGLMACVPYVRDDLRLRPRLDGGARPHRVDCPTRRTQLRKDIS